MPPKIAIAKEKADSSPLAGKKHLFRISAIPSSLSSLELDSPEVNRSSTFMFSASRHHVKLCATRGICHVDASSQDPLTSG